MSEDWARVNADLLLQGLTDGLPVVPPTPERVAAAVAASGRPASEVIATLRPSQRPATVEQCAVNAVMAGCRPEYLPVVLAAIAALAAPEFNLLGVQTTTGSAAPLLLVGGPIVDDLRLNGATDAFGPGRQANATIGRAVRLILRNVGGARPGVTDMATLGQPGKYTWCAAENVEESPWPPLHARRGLVASDSAVTVVGAAGFVELVDGDSADADDLLTTLAHSLLIPGTLGGGAYLGGGQPLLLLPPEHAALLARDGLDPAAVAAELWRRAQLPLDRLSPPLRAGLIRDRRARRDPEPEAPVRIAARPEDVLLAVVGGPGRKAGYVPSWSGGGRAVTYKIKENSPNI